MYLKAKNSIRLDEWYEIVAFEVRSDGIKWVKEANLNTMVIEDQQVQGLGEGGAQGF